MYLTKQFSFPQVLRDSLCFSSSRCQLYVLIEWFKIVLGTWVIQVFVLASLDLSVSETVFSV